MERKKIIIAANITYSGFTYNTRLLVEFEHTGVYYFIKKHGSRHISSNIDFVAENKKKGKKVFMSAGHYVIDRLAIPAIPQTGSMDWWYINNDGDNYTLNKVSKYAQKVYAELNYEVITPLN